MTSSILIFFKFWERNHSIVCSFSRLYILSTWKPSKLQQNKQHKKHHSTAMCSFEGREIREVVKVKCSTRISPMFLRYLHIHDLVKSISLFSLFRVIQDPFFFFFFVVVKGFPMVMIMSLFALRIQMFCSWSKNVRISVHSLNVSLEIHSTRNNIKKDDTKHWKTQHKKI